MINQNRYPQCGWSSLAASTHSPAVPAVLLDGAAPLFSNMEAQVSSLVERGRTDEQERLARACVWPDSEVVLAPSS